MHNLIFGPALFYDLPEYLNIVSTHPFWQSLLIGHFPIHPVFIAILWPLIKILPVNAIAMFFAIATIFILSKISKKAAALYAIFPLIFIININLMVESVLLFFFTLAVFFYLKGKKFWFFLCVFLMVGTHLEGIFWIPGIFLTAAVLGKKIKFFEFIKPTIFAVLLSLFGYYLIYKFSGLTFAGSGEQLMTYFSSGILRMTRNVWLTFSTAFGSLTIFILGFLVFKNSKTKKEKIACVLSAVLTAVIAANWQGDLMSRRIAFAGVILAIGMSRLLKKWWWIFALYLVPITLSNIILYAKETPFSNFQIPPNQVLIQTHYLKPFTKYNGEILYIGESDFSELNKYLLIGKRVFLTMEAVTAPYRLLVGNNYHITSLSRVGDSESRFLFEKYKISKYGNVLELKIYNGPISKEAGIPVIYYGSDFLSRLSRRRIDYGDIGTWIWVILTNNRDPLGWSYIDASGAKIF